MPRTKLTQLAVDKLKEPGCHWDKHLPGFGLRISQGKKSWIVFYRVKRHQVMQTLGSLDLIPKVEAARNMARESQLQARSGINPVAERRRNDEQEQQKGATTFKAVAERWFRERAQITQKADTLKETRRYFDKIILPHWAKHDIASISRADIRRLLDRVKDDNTLIVANKVLVHLRTFFRWAVKQEFIEKDPTAAIERLLPVVERDRILSDEEIVKFWNACEATGWPFGPLFQLLLLTGQRRDEVGNAVRSEFNDKLWVIPGSRTKNGRIHEVQLSDLAIEIINSLPIINGSKYLFTTNGSTPVSGWSTAKLKLDKIMGDMPDWRLHDLRRTAASGMARMGIAPHVVDKVLKHSSGKISGVAAVYNRFEYGPDRR
jgi:integrase